MTKDEIQSAQNLIQHVNLGPEWEFIPSHFEDSHIIGKFEHVIYHCQIYIANGGYGHDKVFNIGHSFARDSQGQSHLSNDSAERYTSINVSKSKTAAQISADIIKRLVPETLRLARLNNDRIVSTEAYLSGKVANGKAIHAQFPELKLYDSISNKDQYRNSSQTVTLGKDYNDTSWPSIDINCGDKTIQVKVDGLSVSEALSVLDIIKRLRA